MRPGYALLWVIVTVGIVAALAAAAAPTLAAAADRQRAVRTAEHLRAMSAAFIEFGDDVGAYPGNISQLTNQISTSSKNSCRAVMTATQVDKWDDDAPFVPFYTPPQGSWTDLGRIRDSIPARSDPPARTPIYAEIPGVSSADAALLARVVD